MIITHSKKLLNYFVKTLDLKLALGVII